MHRIMNSCSIWTSSLHVSIKLGILITLLRAREDLHGVGRRRRAPSIYNKFRSHPQSTLSRHQRFLSTKVSLINIRSTQKDEKLKNRTLKVQDKPLKLWFELGIEFPEIRLVATRRETLMFGMDSVSFRRKVGITEAFRREKITARKYLQSYLETNSNQKSNRNLSKNRGR